MSMTPAEKAKQNARMEAHYAQMRGEVPTETVTEVVADAKREAAQEVVATAKEESSKKVAVPELPVAVKPRAKPGPKPKPVAAKPAAKPKKKR